MTIWTLIRNKENKQISKKSIPFNGMLFLGLQPQTGIIIFNKGFWLSEVV